MFVPFSVRDFLDRAVTVYGDRVGVVDEPDAAGTEPGRADLRPDRGPGAPPGRPARPARHRAGRAGRGREPQQQPAAHVVLRRLGLGPDPGAGELPAAAGRGAVHRRAVRLPGALRRPRARGVAEGRRGRAQVRPRHRLRPLCGARRRAGAVGARRECDGDDQLHVGHHRSAEGRADHAPQHLDQRGDLRPPHHDQRPRRLPPHAAAVPRQRVGHAVRDDRRRRAAHHPAQGRRRRDPAPGARPRGHHDVRGAGRGRGGARRAAGLGGRDPRSRPRCGS